ncbi:MAG: HlyC/CorC family transporter [Rickettsiales bacterium]|jgi:Mg2+/Co2+ transporter CorB|nr:HlyC/CorC family transporter [Rickettsiales bacterium]
MELIFQFNPSYLFIIILIILSAFFSSSETALTSLSRAKIHKLKKQGNKRALLVSNLRKDKDLLISAILIGNNVVNILASVLTATIFINLFNENAVVLSTITMTLLLVVFAEVLPKSYAIYNAEKLSLILAPYLRIFLIILIPMAKLLKICTQKFFTPHKTSNNKKEDLISAIEELRGVIELHQKEGLIVKEDKDMLDSILDLSETDVNAVMTHRKHMYTLEADTPNEEILEHMLKSPYTRMPIWRETKDNIIGTIHAKDLLKSQMYSTKEFKELDITRIASKPWFIPETTSLKDQLLAFRNRRNHFAIVVDEYGSVQGIITLEDILEEIVGDIKDEYDKGALTSYRKTGNNSFIVDGSATIRDINRDFDFELPEDDAATIAGLLINISGKIPERGEIFTSHNFEFKVIEKHRNQLTKISIKKLDFNLEQAHLEA